MNTGPASRLGRLAAVAAGLLAFVAASPAASAGAPDGMVLVPAGRYAPVLRGQDEPAEVAVRAFYLDVHPVTNAEFLAFVVANPRWRRSRVPALFADVGYLAEWGGDLELGPLAPADAPVVRVSWFAARAYARWRGCRLPTTAEWERAAHAGYATDDGANEPAYRAFVLDWLARPNPTPWPAVGRNRPDVHGVCDLAGLVWEWVADFNSALVTGESRADSDTDRDLFCGAGAAGSRNPADFAAFLRSGFRSSLRGSYVVPNLGFRCARDADDLVPAARRALALSEP